MFTYYFLLILSKQVSLERLLGGAPEESWSHPRKALDLPGSAEVLFVRAREALFGPWDALGRL